MMYRKPLIHALYWDEVDNFIGSFPDKAIFLKDQDSIYLNSNLYYAQKYGFESTEELIGLSDKHLNPQLSSLYLRDDQSVIKTLQPKNIYNPAFYPMLGQVFVEGQLVPVLNRNNSIAGLVGILDVRKTILEGSFLSVLNYLQQHNIANYLSQKSFALDSCNLIMSKNELVCYFYSVSLNFSSKQIGELMSLSPRTVEKYLERVREKNTLLPEKMLVDLIQNLILQNLS